VEPLKSNDKIDWNKFTKTHLIKLGKVLGITLKTSDKKPKIVVKFNSAHINADKAYIVIKKLGLEGRLAKKPQKKNSCEKFWIN
jgi:hypothetical protein